MNKVAEHEKRSQEIADTTRRFLIAVHTGGIGVTFALSSALAGHGINPSWAVWPVVVFAGGLVIVGVSLMLAKHRELKRRDAAKKSKNEPDFSGFFWHSYMWDIISLFLFIMGVVVGLASIHGIDIDP